MKQFDDEMPLDAVSRKAPSSQSLRAPSHPGAILCTKCGIAKAPEKFSRDRRERNGRQSQCKICDKAYNAAHRDSKRKYNLKYRAAHRNEMLKQNVAWRASHRDEVQEYNAAYHAVHRNEARGWHAAWRASHRNEVLKREAAYRESHRDEIKAYFAAHKSDKRRSDAAWCEANPERHAMQIARGAHKRRAREEVLPATLTLKQWRATLQAFDNRCAYCGSNGPFHQDHVIPVSKGGGLEAGNIVPACQVCNLSKHNHGVQAWMKHKGYDYGAFVAKLASLEVDTWQSRKLP